MYYLYASIASVYYHLHNYNYAIDIIDEYFTLEKDEIGTDIEMYMIKASSCFKLKKYTDSRYCYEKYIDCYRKYRQGFLHTVDTFQHSINFINNASYLLALINLTKLYIETSYITMPKNSSIGIKESLPRDDNSYTEWLEFAF